MSRGLAFFGALGFLLLPAGSFGANAPAPDRAAASTEKPATEPATAPPPLRPQDDEAIRREMAELCRRQTEGEHPYFGEAAARSLTERLDRPGQSPQVQAGVRGRLGTELLRLGRLGEAIRHFDEAVAIVRQAGLGDPLLAQLQRDLAVALMQRGEEENCVSEHGEASCILPLSPEAVHRRAESVRRAGDLLAEILERGAGRVQDAWLLNLSRRLAGAPPEAVAEVWRLPPSAFDSPPEAGGLPFLRNRAHLLGTASFDLSGGAVMEDLDGDGLLDLVTSTWDPCGSIKAFRNDGDGGFEDVGEAWGLSLQKGGLNLIHGDVDNDGRPDLLILRGAWQGRAGEIRPSLLRNAAGPGGRPRFVDVTADAGLAVAAPTQAAAFGDVDGDGDLDLFIAQEATAETPYPSRLLINDGVGRFVDRAAELGVANRRFAKGAAFGDIDDDGDLDLFVANFGPNRLYRNDGADGFTDIAAEAGVLEPRQAFTTWFFDFDNDGDLDLFVGDYGAPYQAVAASYFGRSEPGHPVVYENRGGRFVDASARLGLDRPLLPMGGNFGDLDHDGWPDVYLGTGVPDLPALMPNVFYWNQAGRRFVDATAATGLGHLQKGHGVAFGDLDQDGDLDLLEQMGGAYPVDAFFNVLYENPGAGNAWITLRLEGRAANRFGVGARIAVRVRTADGNRTIHALGGTGGSFGGSSLQQEIGLGDARSIEKIEVRWPGSGTVQSFEELELNRIYRLVEGEDAPEPIPASPFRLRIPAEAPASPHHPASHDRGGGSGTADPSGSPD